MKLMVPLVSSRHHLIWSIDSIPCARASSATSSISSLSGEYEDAPVQYEQLGRAVVKPNRLRLSSDRRRVDLQRQPERDVPSGLDMAEAEGEAAVGGALRERLRCLPVDGVAV